MPPLPGPSVVRNTVKSCILTIQSHSQPIPHESCVGQPVSTELMNYADAKWNEIGSPFLGFRLRLGMSNTDLAHCPILNSYCWFVWILWVIPVTIWYHFKMYQHNKCLGSSGGLRHGSCLGGVMRWTVYTCVCPDRLDVRPPQFRTGVSQLWMWTTTKVKLWLEFLKPYQVTARSLHHL